MKSFMMVLALFALRANASGCLGPTKFQTGAEDVRESRRVKLDTFNGGLNCRGEADGATCQLRVDGLLYRGYFHRKTPAQLRAHFAAYDGRDVEAQKVNLEYQEYDDCAGEQTRPKWWRGHHRLIVGLADPMYSPDDRDEPPF